MLLWLFLGLTCLAVIVLNIFGSTTVLRSRLDSNNKKRLYLLLIWLAPVLGVITVPLLISRDMKKTKSKNDKELVAALNNFGKRINAISDGIKKKQEDDNKPH